MRKYAFVLIISIAATFSLLFSVGAVPPKKDSAENIKKLINSGSKDLSNKVLQNMKLNNMNLKDVLFNNSDLSGADLSGVDLTHCDFTVANLTNAYLAETDLTGVKFAGATLVNTKMSRLKGFQGAIFDRANINVAWLDPATSYNVYRPPIENPNFVFYQASFVGARIKSFFVTGLNSAGTFSLLRQSASIEKISLMYSQLYGLDLKGLKLPNMTFQEIDARGCNFTGADLTAVKILGASFQDCDFTRCKLDNLNIDNDTWHGAKSNFAGSKIPVRYKPLIQTMKANLVDWDKIVWVN